MKTELDLRIQALEQLNQAEKMLEQGKIDLQKANTMIFLALAKSHFSLADSMARIAEVIEEMRHWPK